TQRSIAERLQGYLSTISERDLTSQSRLQVALVLRQLGNISMAQGQLVEALALFTRSRDALEQLSRDDPGNSQALFELGQAEFWIGWVHTQEGRWDLAERSLSSYFDVSSALFDSDQDNAQWAMEMAYALSNLGMLERQRVTVNPSKVLENLKAAMEYNRRAVELQPDESSYQIELADSHANLADAWLEVCNLGEALASRIENVSFARQFFLSEPGNNRLKLRLAFSLSGLAGVQRMVGLEDEAMESLTDSVALLGQLAMLDPSNLTYRWNLHRKRASIASLLAAMGATDESWSLSASIESELRKLSREDQVISVVNGVEFAAFLLHYSNLAFDRGDQVLASRWLNEATERLQEILREHPDSKAALEEMQLATYQYWHQNENSLPSDQSLQAYTRIMSSDGVQGCDDAAIAARLNILQGDKKSARDYTQYLLGKGYYEPEFAQFCRKHELCDET
ncbi:MAG: hypothetical protein HKN15_08505, partial [Xanthomonadales bacterium]|nr:hypothetical protein [Xanthomonadales bacterium]